MPEKVYNADIMEAIHELDKKLVTHLGLINNHAGKIGDLWEDIYDHNKEGGIKFQNKTMWDERTEKRGMSNGVKVAIVISVINGLLATGTIFKIF